MKIRNDFAYIIVGAFQFIGIVGFILSVINGWSVFHIVGYLSIWILGYSTQPSLFLESKGGEDEKHI